LKVLLGGTGGSWPKSLDEDKKKVDAVGKSSRKEKKTGGYHWEKRLGKENDKKNPSNASNERETLHDFRCPRTLALTKMRKDQNKGATKKGKNHKEKTKKKKKEQHHSLNPTLFTTQHIEGPIQKTSGG